MSSRERHRRAKRFRLLCVKCRARKARFKYRGDVRADRDHTLCFECYRAELNRVRAGRLSSQGTAFLQRSVTSGRSAFYMDSSSGLISR